MGKKDKKKLRVEVDDADEMEETIDDDLLAELEAVEAINKEKKLLQNENDDSHANKQSDNINALRQSLQSFPSMKLPFNELYTISELPLSMENDLDDLQREMAFYEHSLKAVAIGRKTLTKLGIPFKRPQDYFCEHVKSDSHMGKIKDDLILQAKKLEAFEQRKQQQLDRKYNKSVNKVNKNNSKSPKPEMNKIDKTVEKVVGSNDKSPVKKPFQSFKRKAMDKKYGHGGKRSKVNTTSSLNDFKDYNPRGGAYVRREKASFKSKGKPNRAGKSTRDKTRNTRKK